VIVELPGVYDPAEAVEVIGKTAQLTLHPVLGLAEPAAGEPTTTQPPASTDELVLADEGGGRLRLGPAALTGEAVGDARAEFDSQFQTRWQVAIEFQGAGGRRWAELTGTAACQPPGDPSRRVAIVLDGQVISSPQVDPSVQCDQGITGGQTVITGDFTNQEAEDLSLLIRAGALPVPVEVVEQRTVGPTLGAAAIKASMQAAVVGAALTMLYMIAYYRLLGGLAAIALLCYGLLSFAVLLALRSTLTLPGIAGFVLAIGMAVDANVLVFERMRKSTGPGPDSDRRWNAGSPRRLAPSPTPTSPPCWPPGCCSSWPRARSAGSESPCPSGYWCRCSPRWSSPGSWSSWSLGRQRCTNAPGCSAWRVAAGWPPGWPPAARTLSPRAAGGWPPPWWHCC
jgi:protein-export membrane protein SecD